jgi:hypothetical protein
MAAQMLSWLGRFVIKPGVKPMKTNNLQADAIVRARQIAKERFKTEWWASGRKLSEFSTTAHSKAIAELANDPTILARATADVERWFGSRSKFSTKAPSERR